MKVGYPCINNSIPMNAPCTFRLTSYSESNLIQTIRSNLIHLNQILKYNVKNNLLFFRISSDLIPFASHPICKFSWYKFFQSEFKQIGDYIKKHNIRISILIHPKRNQALLLVDYYFKDNFSITSLIIFLIIFYC